MAQDDRFDLARVEQLERRLQALEDAEAIRNLKARYAALCDAQYDADGIAMLFTEDALWESPGLGRFEGREAIRGFFRGASGIFSFAIRRAALRPVVAGIPRQPVRHPTIFGRYREFDEFLRGALCASDRKRSVKGPS
jgi:hypothetical protein